MIWFFSSSGGGGGDLVRVKEDEFWDYDRQVDLEGVTANTLYDKLSSQSHSVTQKVERQKEEAKSLYQKVRIPDCFK